MASQERKQEMLHSSKRHWKDHRPNQTSKGQVGSLDFQPLWAVMQYPNSPDRVGSERVE